MMRNRIYRVFAAVAFLEVLSWASSPAQAETTINTPEKDKQSSFRGDDSRYRVRQCGICENYSQERKWNLCQSRFRDGVDG